MSKIKIKLSNVRNKTMPKNNNITKMLNDSFEKRHTAPMSKGILDACRYYGIDPSSIRH